METLHLLVFLVVSALAGEVTAPGRLPSVPALYAPPALEWSLTAPGQTASPLDLALARLTVKGVDLPGLSAPDRVQALAPAVDQLAHLGMDAKAFAAHSAQEQDVALELALHAAQEDVRQKAYELVGRAKTLVWSESAVDKKGRDELYAVAYQLGELKDHYLSFIPADERDFVLQGELQARARFHDVQKALVEGTALPSAEALMRDRSGSPREKGAVAAASPKPRSGSGTAAALLERMKATKSGWGQKDLDTVYRGYGFVMEEGGAHRKYYHPQHPQLWTMVSRQNDLAPGYAQTAVKLIAELERLQGPALPASAVLDPLAAVPPLPKPGPLELKTPKKTPETVARVEAPLERRPSPKPARPQKTSPKAEKPVVSQNPAALKPAEERPAEAKPEPPPAPAARPEEAKSWRRRLERLKRLFGWKG